MELFQLYILVTNHQEISLAGVKAIQDFIHLATTEDWKFTRPDARKPRYLYPLGSEWVWAWQESPQGPTFPKRVRHYYYQKYGLKAPDKFVEQVGNLARQHTLPQVTYRFDFTDDLVNWEFGRFGDGSSCFSGSNSGALVILRDNGAWGVRFYDENNDGLARAWVVRRSDFFIVFNGYGFHDNSTRRIAQVLAEFSGRPYKKISLSNYGQTSGLLWINGSGGYVIGEFEDDDYDLEFDCDVDTCASCGDWIQEGEVYYGPDDLAYCEQCFCDNFSTCDRCGEPHYHEEITRTATGEWVCEWCLDRHFTRCDECDRHFRAGDITVIDGISYCEGCLPQGELPE